MADRMAATICIGGALPAALVPDLCRELREASVGVQGAATCFRPENADDLMQACHDGWLCLQDDEVPWGEFGFEGFLQQQGISYDRFTEPKYDRPAVIVSFRPGGGVVCRDTTILHEPFVLTSQLVAVEDALVSAVENPTRDAVQQALTLLRAAVPPKVVPLPPLTIQ